MKPGGPVQLLGDVPGDRIASFLGGARAFIFPGEEDCGIAPVEAQACGVPVIAFGRGGAKETVVGLDGSGADATGLFFEDQSVEGLVAAVETFEKVEREFDPERIRANAMRFDRPVFKRRMREILAREFGTERPLSSAS